MIIDTTIKIDKPEPDRPRPLSEYSTEEKVAWFDEFYEIAEDYAKEDIEYNLKVYESMFINAAKDILKYNRLFRIYEFQGIVVVNDYALSRIKLAAGKSAMIIDTTQTKIERQLGYLTPRHVKGCSGLFHLQGGIQVLLGKHFIDGIPHIGTDKCCCRDSMVPGSCAVCHGYPFGSLEEDWVEFKKRNPGSFCSQAIWSGFKFRARHNFWKAYGECNRIECRKCSAINYLSPYMFDDGYDWHDRWCIECSATNLFPDNIGEGGWEKIVALGESFPRRLISRRGER